MCVTVEMHVLHFVTIHNKIIVYTLMRLKCNTYLFPQIKKRYILQSHHSSIQILTVTTLLPKNVSMHALRWEGIWQ